MSVKNKDVVWYGSATMADDDVTTQIGGAIDRSIKMSWADLNSTAQVEIVASGATTEDVVVHFRNAAGEKISETLTLAGTTPSPSSASAERLLKAIKQGSIAADVAVMSTTNTHTGTAQAGGADYIDLDVGASGTDDAYRHKVLRIVSGTGANQIREIVKYDGSGAANPYRAHVRDWDTQPDATSVFEIADGMVLERSALIGAEVMECRRIGYDISANPTGGSDVVVYEKVFCYNNHATLALTNAEIQELQTGIETGANDFVAFDLESSLDGTDDNGSGNARTVAPGGYTFDSSDKTVPNSGNFSPGSGVGIWLEITLPDGTAAQKSFYELQCQGAST